MPSLFFVWFACKNSSQPISPNNQESVNNYQTQRLIHYNNAVYPALKKSLQTGDLLLRLGSDITSEMLRQLNLKDKRYSHCGIVSIEGDTAFVYHAIGGEFNPDQKIKREPLYSFCHPAENEAAAVLRPKTSSRLQQQIALQAKHFWQQGIPFDMSFDYNTDGRLYCAEMVSKAVSRAIADSSWFSFTHLNGRTYVAVDNLSGSSLMHMIEQFAY